MKVEPLLIVRNLKISYAVRGDTIKAVRDVGFELGFRESLCIVGESGSGKTTLAMAIAGSLPPNAIIESGEIIINGVNILRDKSYSRMYVSLVPQEVGASLSPFHTIEEIFLDVLSSKGIVDRGEALGKARKLLKLVGLDDVNRILKSYPHELSGGMLQRILIALALSRDPLVLIADEPTSMIDASLRKGIVILLRNLTASQDISMVIVTHDIALTPHLCRRSIVMYAGKIVEEGFSDELLKRPLHPYTKMLVDSIPLIRSRKELKAIPGLPPDLRNPPRGCSFEPRCPMAIKGLCDVVEPPLVNISPDRRVACHLIKEAR